MKTETISHTPTPWEIGTDGWIQAKSEIDPSMSVKMVARVNINFFTSKEDGAFIVRAVNAHEELLGVVKALLDKGEDININFASREDYTAFQQLVALARTAIAKAEGQ